MSRRVPVVLLLLSLAATGVHAAPEQPATAVPQSATAVPQPSAAVPQPPGAVPTIPPPSPAAEAQAAAEAFVAAEVPARIAEAVDRLADDVIVFDEGLDGQPVRLEGREAVRKYLQGRSQELMPTRNTLEDVLVRATQDAAWVAGTWNHEISFEGETDLWKQLVTFYVRREPTGVWKIAGWHASPAESPEEAFEGSPEEMGLSDAEETPEAATTPGGTTPAPR